MSVPEWRESAYAAVRASGQLTDDAWVNARIWRAVEFALNDVHVNSLLGRAGLSVVDWKGVKHD
jgi:hypothetical protein